MGVKDKVCRSCGERHCCKGVCKEINDYIVRERKHKQANKSKLEKK